MSPVDVRRGNRGPSLAAVQVAALRFAGAASTAVAKAFTIYAFSKLNEVATLMAMIPVEVTA